MDELKKLLAEVDDAYEDFVIGVAVRTKKNKEHIENLIKYIKENEEARTDDIIEYQDKLLGLMWKVEWLWTKKRRMN